MPSISCVAKYQLVNHVFLLSRDYFVFNKQEFLVWKKKVEEIYNELPIKIQMYILLKKKPQIRRIQ